MIFNSIEITGYLGIFGILVFLAWLSHRELKHSASRAGKVEKTLEQERNHLERRVAERTEALIDLEREKTEHRSRMAQLGELSQGLFHDLMNPLTSLSLYLEQLGSPENQSDETRKNMGKIVDISRRMNSFMDSVKRSLGKTDLTAKINRADVKRELEMVRDVLAYKARMAGVSIIIEKCDPISMPIHPVRLHQLLVNLVSNGIEACIVSNTEVGSNSDRISRNKDKWVKISVIKMKSENNERGAVIIRVADNGCGISVGRVQTLFKDPISTKSGGVGIGLTTVKTIVENELQGTVKIESEVGRGTIFIIKIPH